MVSSFHFLLREAKALAMRLCSRAHKVCITASWGCSVTRGSPSKQYVHVNIIQIHEKRLAITGEETCPVGTIGRNRKEVAVPYWIVRHFQLPTSKRAHRIGCCAIAAVNCRSVQPVRGWIKLIGVTQTAIKTRTGEGTNQIHARRSDGSVDVEEFVVDGHSNGKTGGMGQGRWDHATIRKATCNVRRISDFCAIP